MAGGEARYVENPVPLTVLEADNVVKAPVLGVELPMVPGIAQVPASRVVALFVPVPDTSKLSPDGIVSAVIVPVDPYTLDTPPPPAPHAPPVVVSNPAVPACTQLPGVNALSVIELLASKVVKVPAAAAEPPMAGGEAR